MKMLKIGGSIKIGSFILICKYTFENLRLDKTIAQGFVHNNNTYTYCQGKKATSTQNSPGKKRHRF